MREILCHDGSESWRHLRDEAGGPGAVILVSNLLMEREVRKKMQKHTADIAPDIRTLASFLEEVALHSIDNQDFPELVPTAEERSMWLEQWLSAHPDRDFRRFSGMKSVTAISNIIGDLYRENQSPGALRDQLEKLQPDGRHDKKQPGKQGSGLRSGIGQRKVLADLLQAYEQEMSKKNWLDRESMPGKMKRCRPHIIRHKKLVIYLVDEIDPVQHHALERIAQSVGDQAELVRIHTGAGEEEMQSILPAGNVGNADKTVGNTDKTGSIGNAKKKDHDTYSEPDESGTGRRGETSRRHLSTFHHPREELEQTLRQILMVISDEKKTSGACTRYQDFVILAGDLSLYEPMVPAMRERFGVPLYTSRGPSLISHPFIRRLLTYLKLEEGGFQIDDVARVFADNRLVLPHLEDHDEQKAPNIRHFSQFCREYNFRTLDDVDDGISRVFDSLLDYIRYEDDEEKEQKRRDGLQRDRAFYGDVIRHLKSLRTCYKTPGKMTLQNWVAWTDSILILQKDLMSREANQARQLLGIILEKLRDSEARLGLRQTFSRSDFFKLLELRLKETRERPEERPGGVLLTEIHQLPEVHDKVVFVLGLHEDGFPKGKRPDFLQFRYEKALEDLTGREGTEAYELGRSQIRRLLAADKPRYLSRPVLVDQKQVMPSPLWLDLEEEMGNQVAGQNSGASLATTENLDWPVKASRILFTDHEIGKMAAAGRAVAGHPKHIERLAEPFRLAALVEGRRRDTTDMGEYDGVVDDRILQQWWPRQLRDDRLPMSISRLDTFASSPQEYFFRYVLRLEPLSEYKDDAESSIKGNLLHQILQEFYSETEEEGPPVWPADHPGHARNRLNSIRRRLVELYRHQLGNPESPFPALLEKNLERVTRWFLDLEIKGREEWMEDIDDARPAVFYPDFGFEMEQNWSFPRNLSGIDVRFSGKIDRIDLTSDGKKALIYDYKSGKSGAKNYSSILNGRSYQLPVYGMYLQSCGISEFLAGYYMLPINGKLKDMGCAFSLGSTEMILPGHWQTKKKTRRRHKEKFKPEEEMAAFMEAIEQRRISWIVHAIRKGRFHVSLENELPWSDFRHITRFDERIQKRRRNTGMKRLQKNNKTTDSELVTHLDSWYLAEDFWKDNNEL